MSGDCRSAARPRDIADPRDGVIASGGREKLVVRTEREIGNASRQGEHADELAGLCIPDPDGFDSAARRDPGPVVAEVGRVDDGYVVEREQLRVPCDVEHMRETGRADGVPADGEEPCAVGAELDVLDCVTPRSALGPKRGEQEPPGDAPKARCSV